jgi:Bax protein
MLNKFIVKPIGLILSALLIFLTFCKNSKYSETDIKGLVNIKIDAKKKEIKTFGDIEPINDSIVNAIDYLNPISLSQLSVKEKKQKFIDLLLPVILISKEKYKRELMLVESLSSKDSLTEVEKEVLAELIKTYKAKDVEDLKIRLKTHPTSVVLAQASIESGWGTSRFFTEANNIFGVWSFNPNDPRIPTLSKRNGKHMYLYKYKTLSESVDDYFKLLATRAPFEKFRKERAITNNPYKIVEYLNGYSERGEEYVKDLKAQIKYNNFTKYDSYRLNLNDN